MNWLHERKTFNWYGPIKVKKVIREFLFEVEDFMSGKTSIANGAKLRFFQNKNWEATEEVKEHLSYQTGEYCVVEQLFDMRKSRGKIELEVRWKGFEDEEPE